MSMKDYEKKLKKSATSLTTTGVGLMAGHAVVGGVANVQGMPAQGKAVAGVVGKGLNLVAVGQMAKTAYDLMPVGSTVSVSFTKGQGVTKKKGPVDKILG